MHEGVAQLHLDVPTSQIISWTKHRQGGTKLGLVRDFLKSPSRGLMMAAIFAYPIVVVILFLLLATDFSFKRQFWPSEYWLDQRIQVNRAVERTETELMLHRLESKRDTINSQLDRGARRIQMPDYTDSRLDSVFATLDSVQVRINMMLEKHYEAKIQNLKAPWQSSIVSC